MLPTPTEVGASIRVMGKVLIMNSEFRTPSSYKVKTMP